MDEVTEGRYRGIYEGMREGRTLREVREVLESLGCSWSIAAWSKFERGKLGLSRSARNALRAVVGMEEVPLTPAEVVEEAGVERVVVMGQAPEVAVLVGWEAGRVVVRGSGGAGRGCPLGVRVTVVTGSRRGAARWGLSVGRDLGLRLAEAKNQAGVTWDVFLGMLLEQWLYHE